MKNFADLRLHVQFELLSKRAQICNIQHRICTFEEMKLHIVNYSHLLYHHKLLDLVICLMWLCMEIKDLKNSYRKHKILVFYSSSWFGLFVLLALLFLVQLNILFFKGNN